MSVLAIAEPRSKGHARIEPDRIEDLVADAAKVIAPVWPLKTFIAVNPLQGLEDLPFEEAVADVGRRRAAVREIAAEWEPVNRELIKWCAAYFDEGQATIGMPGREAGFYGTFAKLARYDARLNRSAAASALLRSLPETPDDAIRESFRSLSIPRGDREEFLRQAFTALPGWSGYVKWKESWQAETESASRPATLVDLIAVRMVLTRLLWPGARVQTLSPPHLPSLLAELPTREAEYRRTLLERLQRSASEAACADRPRPDAQLVFCIDVRSEPFRRSLEAVGAYETFGFAGFFGLPVQWKQEDGRSHDACPVLLKPRHAVHERPSPSVDESCVRRHRRGLAILRTPTNAYRSLKYNFATPFALAEILGPWLGLRMLARNFAPAAAESLRSVLRQMIARPVPRDPCLDEISLAQKIEYGESALRMMGLTENLAPLIVLCGHGSTTANNAYASALDCGACGGNRGGGNARILAAILNLPQVRESLAERGIAISTQTLFVAAEHDTTTDHVELDTPSGLSDSQRSRVESLREDLRKAQIRNAKARASAFGTTQSDDRHAVDEVLDRSSRWSQVRPEWGLARNAAFIAAPRELTRGVDLEGRCFLHSYDWRTDHDGRFLTAILTAPMVVAQWINGQYLFSTLDNVAYGSGSKVTQNVTGKIGVMQGNSSDLMSGLPLQSVFANDRERYHEPLRLLTVVHAPRPMLEAIVHSQPILRKLCGNGWITISCIDPGDRQALRLDRDLRWQAIE